MNKIKLRTKSCHGTSSYLSWCKWRDIHRSSESTTSHETRFYAHMIIYLYICWK